MKANDPGRTRASADAVNVTDHSTRWAKVPLTILDEPRPTLMELRAFVLSLLTRTPIARRGHLEKPSLRS